MNRCWSSSAIAIALAALVATGCARRLYDGPELPADRVAVVELGDVSIRNVDDRFDFFIPFGVQELEVKPGPHQILFVFERQASSIGVRDIPYRLGEGVCTLEFVAEAGKRYRLDAEALDDDSNSRDWYGEWRGWISDISHEDVDDVIAGCTPSDKTPVPRSVRESSPTPAAQVAISTPAPAVIAPAPAVPPAPPPLPVAAPVPTPAETPAVAKSMESIRLGAWNLRSLGADEDRDYAAIAGVIENNFDILALNEIAHRDGGHPGYDRLLAALGSDWIGLVTESPRPNVDSSEAEHYAILHRADRIRTCAGWPQLRYVADNDGSAPEGGADRFEREPAFGCFETGFEGSQARLDFILAAYRATWAGGDTDAIAVEVANIDWALGEMASGDAGGRDVIVAGQLNLDTVELELFTSATIVTEGSGASLNLLGEPTFGLRDHILLRQPAATIATIGPGRVLDVRGVASSPREFRRTVSDHLPVAVTIRIPPRD